MKDICLLRKGMIAELETVNDYRKMQEECESEEAKQIFADIIDEELIHVGEFMATIDRLCPHQDQKISEGKKEAVEKLSNSLLADTLIYNQ